MKSIYKTVVLLGAALLMTSCHVEMKTSTECLVDGKEYFKAGHYKEAEAAFRDALRLDPNSPEVKATATNNLGVILSEDGRYDEAITVFKEATGVDPKNAIAHYVLAGALIKKVDMTRL